MDVAEPGLRERKKAQTRALLRAEARSLFAEKGFDATTVAEIAAAADVSEPTFFRYYGSKVAVALEPLHDTVTAIIDAVIARPASELPLDACLTVSEGSVDAGLWLTHDEVLELQSLIASPDTVAGVLAVFDKATERLTVDFARRLGAETSDPVARQTATVAVGTLLSTLHSWLTDPTLDPVTMTTDGLQRLRGGLR